MSSHRSKTTIRSGRDCATFVTTCQPRAMREQGAYITLLQKPGGVEYTVVWPRSQLTTRHIISLRSPMSAATATATNQNNTSPGHATAHILEERQSSFS